MRPGVSGVTPNPDGLEMLQRVNVMKWPPCHCNNNNCIDAILAKTKLPLQP